MVDVYGVSMTSRTAIGLVEMYFVFRVLIKELGYDVSG